MRAARRPGATAIYWAATLLLAAVAAFPLLAGDGLLNTRGGGDSPFLLQRVHQLVTALRDGHFPVRWMPDANFGYGYPFFHYYAPLSIYVAALFRGLGFAWVHAIQLAQLAGFLVAAAGAFALGRRWFGRPDAGFLAGVAYTYAPFHLVNVYVRGDSLAEFWAMAWYPWLLLAAERLVDADRDRRAVVAALLPFGVLYAALALSHNISFAIFTPFILLYGAVRLQLWRPTATVWRLLPGLALGLALAAWFWLPAFAEQGNAQLAPVTAGYFSYDNHFRGFDLVQPSPLFDYRIDAGADPFRMGLLPTLLGLVGFAWAIRRRSEMRPPLVFLAGAFLLATFMITPLSRLLWDTLPVLPFTQFPWRFLSVQALPLALATAGWVMVRAGDAGRGRARRLRRAVAPAVALMLTAAGLVRLQPAFLPLGDVDVSAERLAAYEWFTGNIGTTVSAEYLPPAVDPPPQTGAWLRDGTRHAAAFVAGDGAVTRLSGRTQRQTWRIEAVDGPATVRLPTLMWPGWRVLDDEYTLTAAPGSGLMLLDVPAGTHTVTLVLGRTSLRAAAESVSLLAALGTVGAWAWTGRRQWRAAARALALGAVAGIALAGAARLIPPPAPDGPRSWDFAQLGYLHPAPDGIRFASGAVLTAADAPATATPGATWTLDWRWQDADDTPIDVELLTPAVHRATAAAPVPAVATARGGPDAPLTVTIPADAPAGLYVPRLRRAGDTALTSTGEARGDLFLAPVRILPGPADVVAVRDVPLQVRLEDVAETDDGLVVKLAWYAPRALGGNDKVSLRLLDSRNLLYMSYDAPPGYGQQPLFTWPAGIWISDWVSLRWLATDGVGPYRLVATVYDSATGAVRTARQLAELTWDGGEMVVTPWEPISDLPDGVSGSPVALAEGVTLHGYRLAQSADTADITLFWSADAPLPASYRHFVHLLGPDGAIVAQHDGVPAAGVYPTTQWLPGEIVVDPAPLPLGDVPPGTYTLVAGLYVEVDGVFRRLPSADGADAVRLTTVTVP